MRQFFNDLRLRLGDWWCRVAHGPADQLYRSDNTRMWLFCTACLRNSPGIEPTRRLQ